MKKLLGIVGFLFLLTTEVYAQTVTWTCDRCTPSSGSGTGYATWSINDIPLAVGENVVTVTATDALGQTSQDTLTVTYEPTFPGAALIGAWGFENNATDSSGNGNTGTLFNGATYTTTAGGKFGQALTLDGINDYLNVSDSNALDFTHGFTFSAWVKPRAVYNDFRAIVVKNYVQGLYASSSPYCAPGAPIGFFIANGVSGPSFNACYATPLAIGSWSHVVTTYDGAALRLYINGVLVTTTTATGYMEPTTGSLQIGASTFGEYFEGEIDEVRVHNRAIPLTSTDGQNAALGAACQYGDPLNLTHQSIYQEYNCPVVASTPPLPVKFPASATGLRVGASATGLKFGQVP